MIGGGTGGGTGPGQTASTISRSLDSGPVLDLRRVRGELLEKEKKKQHMYKVKKILYLTTCSETLMLQKKKKQTQKKRGGVCGRVAGVIFLLYIRVNTKRTK